MSAIIFNCLNKLPFICSMETSFQPVYRVYLNCVCGCCLFFFFFVLLPCDHTRALWFSVGQPPNVPESRPKAKEERQKKGCLDFPGCFLKLANNNKRKYLSTGVRVQVCVHTLFVTFCMCVCVCVWGFLSQLNNVLMVRKLISQFPLRLHCPIGKWSQFELTSRLCICMCLCECVCVGAGNEHFQQQHNTEIAKPQRN